MAKKTEQTTVETTKTVEQIKRAVNDLQKLADSLSKSADDFFDEGQDPTEMGKLISRANRIDLMALTGYTTLRDFGTPLITALTKQKARLRILFIADDPNLYRMMQMRDGHGRSAEHQKANRQTLIKTLYGLQQKVGFTHQTSAGEPSIQAKALNYMFPYSLHIIQKDSGPSYAYVKLYTYKIEYQKQPAFSIISTEAVEAYNIFVGQFEAMWKDAEDVDIKAEYASLTPQP